MPSVLVKAKRDHPALASDGSIAELAEWLRVQVARELSCSDPDGQLTADDIEVDVVDYDPTHHFGGKKFDIQIVVFAGEYPNRRANLHERRERLQASLKATYGARMVHGYVWLLPIDGSFGEF